jgi:hypothetical protein
MLIVRAHRGHADMALNDFGAIGDNGRLSDRIPGAKKELVWFWSTFCFPLQIDSLHTDNLQSFHEFDFSTDAPYFHLNRDSSSQTTENIHNSPSPPSTPREHHI